MKRGEEGDFLKMANEVVVRRAWPRQCRRASRTPAPCSGSGSGSSAQPDQYTILNCLESSVVDPDPHHFGNLDPHPDPIRIK